MSKYTLWTVNDVTGTDPSDFFQHFNWKDPSKALTNRDPEVQTKITEIFF